MKSKGITRRQLAAGSAALPAFAQNVPAPAKPADELETVRAQAKQTSAALRDFKIDMLLEPSVVFKP